MSRWDANSDLDYTDQPWAAKLLCIERGCEQERATFSVFCATCLARHEEKLVEQRARELAERRSA